MIIRAIRVLVTRQLGHVVQGTVVLVREEAPLARGSDPFEAGRVCRQIDIKCRHVKEFSGEGLFASLSSMDSFTVILVFSLTQRGQPRLGPSK